MQRKESEMPAPGDADKTGRAKWDRFTEGYLRRARAREAERGARRAQLEEHARRAAAALRARYGDRVQLYLFGSALDADRFRTASDLDLAVVGLTPAEYWEAWATVEEIVRDSLVDFIRLEDAAEWLRSEILHRGRALP